MRWGKEKCSIWGRKRPGGSEKSEKRGKKLHRMGWLGVSLPNFHKKRIPDLDGKKKGGAEGGQLAFFNGRKKVNSKQSKVREKGGTIDGTRNGKMQDGRTSARLM